VHQDAGRGDRAVEVLPLRCGQRLSVAQAAALGARLPDAAVVADDHVAGVVRLEGDGVEVGVQVVAEALPVLAAVGAAVDAAGLR
jgi:hypothetical protein